MQQVEGVLRPRLLGGLQPVDPDRAGLGEALVEQGGGVADLLLHAAGGATHALADTLDRHGGGRIEQGCDQAQLPIHIEHGGDETDDGNGVAERVYRPDHRFAYRDRVGGEAGRELGRRLTLDPGHVGTYQMTEHPSLEVADDDQHQVLHRHRLAVLRGRLGAGDHQHECGTW